MAKAKNVKDDYTVLSEASESVVIVARIIERSEKFTVAQTAAALYTIPNDGITSVKQLKAEDGDISEIRVKPDIKMVRKTLVVAARIAGFRFGGAINHCEQCCEQCCNQCCEQCCNACDSGIRIELADSAVVAVGAFRTALG